MNPASSRRPAGAVGSFLAVFLLCAAVLRAEPLVSPTWGFRLDPPEGYAFSGGDGKNRFSFAAGSEAGGPGARLDLVVYGPGRFGSVEKLAEDVRRRLGATGETASFAYRGKNAVLLRFDFSASNQAYVLWGLCVQLAPAAAGAEAPLLTVLAYAPADQGDLEALHLSALDSLAPTPADRLAPGPITVFAYPPGARRSVPLPGLGVTALIDENDAEAARACVDREFSVLRRYADSPFWQEAWTRFYRALYRDAYDRLADVAFAVERALAPPSGADPDRRLAEKALGWVQNFSYERDLLGTDFVDLVSAATEGRGDCDSRALLWAILLRRANIPAAIMVSRDYAHAMALVELAGSGARFELGGRGWLVAETTAKVGLGMIGANVSDSAKWLGILLE